MLSSKVLVSGNKFGVAKLQSRHEGGMNLTGGNDGSLELLIACGAGVVDDHALVAQIAGRTNASIHTHVTHRATDHDLLDTGLIKDRLQVRLSKRVDMVLEDNLLSLKIADFRVDLRSLGARSKERGFRGRKLVPDMND